MSVNQEYIDTLKSSPLTPPNIVFRIVWPILYTILAYIAATSNVGWLFVAHMVLNFSWSPVFFGLKQPAVAMGILVAMLCTGFLIAPTVSPLFYVYLGWISFAAYLNAYIVVNN